MPVEFKTIGIIGKFANVQIQEQIITMFEYLENKGLRVLLDQGTAEALQIEHIDSLPRAGLGEESDLIIVLGGDGTLLNAARSLVKYEIPIIGVNLGRLGFLTDILWDNFQQKLDEIFLGDFQQDDRLMLDVEIVRSGVVLSKSIAFNEVVVHKWEEARMLEFETYIDGGFVNTQRSDGLIISTPTGSTAYALSGGGPIMEPSLHVISLVPICPHTLSQRPLMIRGDSEVVISISEAGHARAQVTCDGQINMGVAAGDKIIIKGYEKRITLLHPEEYNYFEILRTKLHWGEKL